jgi:uncharacterized membrane protein
MKQNTFYLLAGIVGLVEVGLFYLSVEFRNPLLIIAGFILGILLLYVAQRRITDHRVDERAALITQKAGVSTFTVFWVVFFATSLGSAVMGLGAPAFPHNLRPPKDGGPGLLNETLGIPGNQPPPVPNGTPGIPGDQSSMLNGTPGLPGDLPALPDGSANLANDGLIRLGYFGYIQLALLFLMFFLYVGFRIYYARKYGEWETDEEQD